MKQYLTDLIARKKNEITELQKRSDDSQDLAEVRSIGETLKKIVEELTEAEAQLAKLDQEEEQPAQEEEQAERSVAPAGAEIRNAQILGAFNLGGKETMENQNMEYRNAFMEHVVRGTAIPAELRDNQNTLTSDVASVIPTHLVNQIIEKFDNVGMILPLITKTNYKAGVQIPTSTAKPEATWTTEGKGSDRQKKATGTITFTYHKLRCEISMSMEVGTMALSAFEAKFVENVSKAMIKAIEEAVINGDGSGKPKGILTETGVTVPTAQLSYAKLAECEGALPVEYETGSKWCMNKKTFYQVLALTDEQGQPIARVNYGLGGQPERTILGRDVVISPYVADNKMFIFDFADYVLNTIYDMGISKKQDWDTEDLLTKAVMSVDGKVVDAGSLVKFDITPTV
jgi:HK97 family phage major capsid protein